MSDLIEQFGGCHCGQVRYSVQTPEQIEVVDCNCSICTKKGIIHFIVPNSKFKLLQGKEKITTYTFNTHVAQHYFCSVCGICTHYIPRSNPDGVDVNIRTLDNFDLSKYTVKPFDGQNWESGASELAHLSK
ncbi:glutathione-dependent formaldehyde-activating [Heterostelium album PN500]|uniref:Glutathione-dependent formaldehyde-activating n=1 Tax=Heterostelium pallidum (strain ATCC 26659 / Pp 5 / PN500) TaxID=670386 RepID=D3BMW3_HETP5|nr:glutathione-dependent formaldehyde-activating [Heterostelium album PN500]EFA77325.1 glutathione-dependent formaldehyde-activating [Heterostelium album PN500]|eukprot:XP_020429454.1 glutathione-dependent formaldehyde-activating [Heterostelium album PN500]